MNKETIVTSVKASMKKVTIKAKKYSPEILIVAGVVGTVASTVLACKATTKIESILEESKNTIDTIHQCSDNKDMADQYSEDDAKKDLAIVYIQTGVKLAKLYAPSVALGTLSIVSMVASNQVDNELRYNIKAKKLEETVTDPETGKEKKVKKTVDVADPTVSDYVMFFDASTSEAYENNEDYNRMTLRGAQQYANDKLNGDGFLFLSDVYDELGIKRTKLSQSVGWVKNGSGDGYVDFRAVETYRENEAVSLEKAWLLDFNVDGNILDLI